MKRRARVFALALATTLALTSCGGDDNAADDGAPDEETSAPEPTSEDESEAEVESPTAEPADGDAEFEALVEAAQAEGALTVYASPTENVVQNITDAFTEKYGISVQFIRFASADFAQRFLGEAEAGTFVADVLLNTDDSPEVDGGFFAQATNEGYVTPLADADIPGYPWEFPEEFIRGSRALVQVLPWLFSFNTDIITDPPMQWPDLLDPQYQDLIIIPDPSVSAAYVQEWLVVLDEYGEEFFEDLRAQNLVVFEAGVPATEAMAAGEGGLMLPSVGSLAVGARDRGAPVDYTIPDVTTGVEISVGLVDLDEAPNPNAAKLFIAYLMSEEGNRELSDVEAAFSVFDTAGLPADYVSPPSDWEERQDEVLELLGIS